MNVHDQTQCKVCHHAIKKLTVSQRGTYLCPNCQKKKVIGITGSMGSGKSEISRYLRKKYPVLDCDQVNADLLKREIWVIRN